MSSLAFALRDSNTMLRREIRHSLRNLAMTLSGLITPVVVMALFIYVFGGTLGAGLGGIAGGGAAYINYVAPAILVMTIGSGVATTAVNFCLDLNQGIISRFRTMGISRGSVLTGLVVGSMLRTMITIVLVLGVSLLLGFRPTADFSGWVGALGMTTLFALALTWMAVLFGQIGKTVAGANSFAQIFQLILPFTSSAFVRPESMPDAMRWFSQYQPFTAVIDTVRGLLVGTPIGDSGPLALGWCVGLTLVGYFWSNRLYNRSAVSNNLTTTG